MKIIPTSIRKLWIRHCEGHFAETAIRSSQPILLNDKQVSLHVVVSKSTWKMALLMLRSFEFHSGVRWKPIIHDDGSLSEAMLKELQVLQPDARIVPRKSANAKHSSLLEAWPTCRENRNKHNFFLKFFDTYAEAPHERYMVIDSDIIFFQRPTQIMSWIESEDEGLHFMEDARETYASPRKKLEEAMGLSLWQSVNSGICLMNKKAVDLELAEQFLKKFSDSSDHFQFLEQTLFALMGSAWKKGGVLPKVYEISWANFRRRNAICRHYLGPSKFDALYVEGAMTFWLQLRARKMMEKRHAGRAMKSTRKKLRPGDEAKARYPRVNFRKAWRMISAKVATRKTAKAAKANTTKLP